MKRLTIRSSILSENQNLKPKGKQMNFSQLAMTIVTVATLGTSAAVAAPKSASNQDSDVAGGSMTQNLNQMQTGDWSIAPLLGGTSFTLKGSDISGAKGGAQVGALVQYQLENPNLRMETGFAYTEMGAKTDAIFASVQYNLNYLTAPLGVRYLFSVPQQNQSHWYSRGGLTLAYLVSAKLKSDSIFGGGGETDIKSETNSFDVLPYAGVGYSWAMAKGQNLDFDLSYTRGLMKVQKEGSTHSEGFIAGLSYSILM